MFHIMLYVYKLNKYIIYGNNSSSLTYKKTLVKYIRAMRNYQGKPHGILLFLAIPPLTASITISNRDNKSIGNHIDVCLLTAIF